MSRLPEATSFPASTLVHDVALWPSLGRWSIAALVALGVWTVTALLSPAQANGVNWSFGVHVPGGAIVVGEHRPVAVYSNPVYPAVAYPAYPVYPAPVYAPPARVYAPVPWGYGSHRGYAPPPPPPHHHRHHGYHHGYHNDRHPDSHAYRGGRHWDDGRGGWDRR